MSISQDKDYPTASKNPHRAKYNFWNELGVDIDAARIDQQAMNIPLFKTLVDREVENDFLVKNKYGKNETKPRGKMSEEAARKILGESGLEDDEMVLRMFKGDSWPEEVYDTPVEVVKPEEVSQQQNLENLEEGYLLLEEFPDGFEFGEYDFLVVGTGGNYILADESGGEYAAETTDYDVDGIVQDLEDMR